MIAPWLRTSEDFSPYESKCRENTFVILTSERLALMLMRFVWLSKSIGASRYPGWAHLLVPPWPDSYRWLWGGVVTDSYRAIPWVGPGAWSVDTTTMDTMDRRLNTMDRGHFNTVNTMHRTWSYSANKCTCSRPWRPSIVANTMYTIVIMGRAGL